MAGGYSGGRTMDGLEHIRSKPGMWGFTAASDEGIYQLLKELTDNSLDEASERPNVNQTIDVLIYDGKDKTQIIVRDQGRGFPLNFLNDAYHKPFTSGKFDGDAYAISIGSYGVGAKATVALSSRFLSVTTQNEGFASVVSNEGVVKSSIVDKRKKYKCPQSGTIALFEPDRTIFTAFKPVFESTVFERLVELYDFQAAFTPNAGFRIIRMNKPVPEAFNKFKPEDMWKQLLAVKGEIVYQSATFNSPEAYLRYAKDIKSQTKLNVPHIFKPVDTKDPRDTVGYDITLFMTKDFMKAKPHVVASVNKTRIEKPDAYHISGLWDSMKKFLVNRIETKEMRSFFTMVTRDGAHIYQLPFNAVVLASFKQASFEGQDKHNFKSDDFKRVYGRYLTQQLKQLHESFWVELYDIIEDDIEAKFHAFNNKGLKTSKSQKNLGLRLNEPASFLPSRSKNPLVTELLICEGDSAGDHVGTNRDHETQAVLKLRGKPLNGIRNDKKLKSDEIFQDMVQIIGVKPGERDLSNMNFSTIVLLADADADGYHISALLIGILYAINPLIVETGRVVLANPPLYVLTARNRVQYIKDHYAYLDLLARTYGEVLEIELESANGHKYTLDTVEFREIVYLIEHIGEIILDVAQQAVVDPLIIEQLAHVMEHLVPGKENTDAIRDKLNLDACVMDKTSRTLIMSSAGIEVHVVLEKLVEDMRAFVMPELEKIHWDKISLNVTTKETELYDKTPLSLVQVHQLFAQLKHLYQVTRLKGLGELDGPQIAETCLARETRSYTTITSMGDVEKVFNLLGTDTTHRKKLVANDLNEVTAFHEYAGIVKR